MQGGSQSPPAKFNRSQDHHDLYLNLIRWELDDEMEMLRKNYKIGAKKN